MCVCVCIADETESTSLCVNRRLISVCACRRRALLSHHLHLEKQLLKAPLLTQWTILALNFMMYFRFEVLWLAKKKKKILQEHLKIPTCLEKEEIDFEGFNLRNIGS